MTMCWCCFFSFDKTIPLLNAWLVFNNSSYFVVRCYSASSTNTVRIRSVLLAVRIHSVLLDLILIAVRIRSFFYGRFFYLFLILLVVRIRSILLFLILLAVRMQPFVSLRVIDRFTASLSSYEQSIYHTLSRSFPQFLQSIDRFTASFFLSRSPCAIEQYTASLSLSFLVQSNDQFLARSNDLPLSISLPRSSFFVRSVRFCA